MFGDALRARLEVLQTRQAGLQARLQDIARGAALRAVEEGTLRGTVLNDAAGQAEDILALSCALAQGEDPGAAVELEDEKYCWRQHTAVTRENLAEFLPEAS